MKTILVLTDFTIKSDHAAHYAIKLAQKIEADILLCNVYPERNVKPVFTHAYWPGELTDNVEEESKNDLNELAGRLTAQMINSDPNAFRPSIKLSARCGKLVDVINDIVKHTQVIMAVIATHSNDDYLSFITGNHTNEIIENASCPVLVIPYQIPFQVFKGIAFATDLRRHRDVLHTLHTITKCLNPDIFITHVGMAPLGAVTEQYILKQLWGEDTNAKAAYPNLHYIAVQNKNVVVGLDSLAQRADIDLMVLVHRKRNFLQKIFNSSTTQKLATHLAKPLLVFPTSHVRASVPVF